MRLTVSTAVASLVRRYEPDLEFRLEAQAEALRERKCVDGSVGQWVHNIEYLRSILDLDDADFAKRFPSVGHVGHYRRQQMKMAIESHLNCCTHCSLKHGYELELDARIMRVCRENRVDLL